jgi:hypothetical protein
MPARRLLLALCALCPLCVSACANTLQDQPLQPSFLEPLVMQDEYPIYWLGGEFRGLGIISVARDPGGAYTIKYGNCRQGGENVCVTPLEVVTSPDNSFQPGGSTPRRRLAVRGVTSLAAQGGRTLAIPTGAVVVGVYADNAALARGAAQTMVAINSTQLPGTRLPRALPDTGFAQHPLKSQEPPKPPAEAGVAAARRTARPTATASVGAPSNRRASSD